MRMRAAALRTPHQPRSVATVAIDAPQAGEAPVRPAAVGVCHSDLHDVDGTRALGEVIRTARVFD